MEATIDVDEELLERAARCAEERGTTLSALVEERLREFVAESPPSEPAVRRIVLPSFRPTSDAPLPEGVTWDRISHIFDDDDHANSL